MKIKYILIAFLTLLSPSLFSQIYVEGLALGCNIDRENSGLSSYGYGYSFSGGYSILEQKLDVGIRHDLLKDIDFEDVFSTGLEIVYKPFKWEYFKPYVGVYVFRFKEVLDPIFMSSDFKPEFGFTASPFTGILFKSDLIDGLFVNLSYSYRYLEKKNTQNVSFHALNFGVKYYFNFMKKEKEK